MTLTAQIRRLTGVTAVEVSDVDVQAALAAHRQWHDALPVILQPNIANVALRGTVDAWGMLEPAAASVTNSLGAAPVGTVTISMDGDIAFSVDQSLAGTLYLSGYGYDVNAAAVDVIDQLLGTYARDYDVSMGEQKLQRSQAVAQLETRRDKLAAGRLAVSVRRVRVDDAGAWDRVSARLQRRAERE